MKGLSFINCYAYAVLADYRSVSESKAPQQENLGRRPRRINPPPTLLRLRKTIKRKQSNAQVFKTIANPNSPKNASQTAALVTLPSPQSKIKSPPVDKDIVFSVAQQEP